jgi:hypothetical protein
MILMGLPVPFTGALSVLWMDAKGLNGFEVGKDPCLLGMGRGANADASVLGRGRTEDARGEETVGAAATVMVMVAKR